MKKHVALAVGLAVLSSNAFATKSRMEALGQDPNKGSLFIQDNRNVFRNAAHVNSMKNYVVTEWGTANDTVDSATAPSAEGGLFREAGAFAWGLNFGSDINQNNDVRNGTTATNVGNGAFIEPENKLDLFFAGDAGVVEWGARLGYGSNKSKSAGATGFESTAKQFGLGLGVIFGDLQAYTNLDLKNDSEGAVVAGDKFESDLGLNLGVNYTFLGYTAWIDYQKQGSELAMVGATFKPEWNSSVIQVGAGRTHEVNSGARLFYSGAFNITKDEKNTASNAGVEEKGTNLNAVIGMEADATSWLVLRGSIGQDVLLSKTETDTKTAGVTATTEGTNINSTDVNAGATLNFGKLKVDGSIGTTAASRAGTTGTENGVLALDNLLTRVAVHYWF